MEENFNEDYLETEKFPNAIFIGKINEPIDYTKNANLKITVTGKLEIHGVTKQKTFEGTIKKSGNEITLTSNFNVNLADYSIKIPSLYAKNISEISNVEVKTILEPYIKK
jgi:polyisoprenoid-binding protein YceI